MSTTSQRMELKIPDGSDPFLRTDHVQNLTTLDKYPGNWICTSTTRPTWGAGQAGMCITETDTRRTLLWSGTTWREMLYGPAVWWGHVRPNISINKATTVTYTIGTFTVNRPGSLFVFLTSESSLPNGGSIGATAKPTVDGANTNFEESTNGNGDFVGTTFPLNSTFGTNRWTQTVTGQGIRNISAGTHSIGIRYSSTQTGSAQTRLVSARASAWFVNATDR